MAHNEREQRERDVTQILVAFAQVVREAGEVPAGVLYAMLCGHLNLDAFEQMLGLLVRAGLVEREGDVLRWIEPEVDE